MAKKQPVEGTYYILEVKLLSKGTLHKIHDCCIIDGVWHRRRYYRTDDGIPVSGKILGWDLEPINEKDIQVVSWEVQPVQDYDDNDSRDKHA